MDEWNRRAVGVDVKDDQLFRSRDKNDAFSAVKEAIQDVENERKNRRGSKVLSIMSPSYEVA